MKRVIAFLLGLAMCLSLCACEKKEKSEVSSKTVIDNNGLQSGKSTMTNGGSSKSKYDFVVEDCKMKIIDDHKFSVKVKVRNNTDTAVHRLKVGYHALDKNGDSLYSDQLYFDNDIMPGQANWSDNWTVDSVDEDNNVEDIFAFGFPNFLVLEEDTKLQHEVYNTYSFTDYFTANVSDISVIHE